MSLRSRSAAMSLAFALWIVVILCCMFLSPLLVGCRCTPAADAGVPSDGDAQDLARPADLSPAPDMTCYLPCEVDGGVAKCPAAIWGVCEAGCCRCHPPDGGSCPVMLLPQ